MEQSYGIALSWIVLLCLCSITLADSIRGTTPSFDASTLRCVPLNRPSASRVPIALSRINDDYCDCADGADEPGTSACENGRFWCLNTAYKGRFIPSAWVDDGNCDCCDGSDEAAGKCADTCASERATAIKVAKDAAAQIMAGVRKRRDFARLVTAAGREEAKQLRSARAELAEVSKTLELCTRHAEGLRARQDATSKQDYQDDTYDAGDDHVPINVESASDGDVSDNGDANGDAVDEESMMEDNSFNNVDNDESADEADEPRKEEDPSNQDEELPIHADAAEKQGTEPVIGDTAENSSDTSKMDPELSCEELSLGSGSTFMQKARLLFTKTVAKLEWISPKLFEKTGLVQSKGLNKCIEQAEEKRSSLESRKLILEDRVRDLEKKSGYNYGPGGVFRQMQGKCFKKKISQYEFEHCPYDVVKQYEHGRLVAQLGRFDKLSEAGEMLYKDGAPCWNGPDRSVTVRLQCGENDEVISVDEPSRCMYQMVFSTPAVCEEAEAKKILAEAKVHDVTKDEL